MEDCKYCKYKVYCPTHYKENDLKELEIFVCDACMDGNIKVMTALGKTNIWTSSGYRYIEVVCTRCMNTNNSFYYKIFGK